MRWFVVAGLVIALSACSPTVNKGDVSNASGKPATEQPVSAKAETPTWGKRYKWPDGLAVEVSPPTACKPGQYAVPTEIKRAVKFKILIVNDTKNPFEAGQLSIGSDAQFNGAKAENIIDPQGACGNGGIESATILPGKTYSYEVAYAVAPAPGELQLAFEPVFGADKAVYVGQA
jgi:hypothetical protein